MQCIGFLCLDYLSCAFECIHFLLTSKNLLKESFRFLKRNGNCCKNGNGTSFPIFHYFKRISLIFQNYKLENLQGAESYFQGGTQKILTSNLQLLEKLLKDKIKLVIVRHVPRELSRYIWYVIQEGAKPEAEVHDLRPALSPWL